MNLLKLICKSYKFFWGRSFFFFKLKLVFKSILRNTFYSNNYSMFVGVVFLLIWPFHVTFSFLKLLFYPMLTAIMYGDRLDSFIKLKEKTVITKESELNRFHKRYENII